MLGLKLDHATIRTTRLEETLAFYQEYLGLSAGWRPSLGSGGAWLYAQGSDYPQLHVIETKTDLGRGGMIDHIAFRGVGLVDYLDKLRSGGQPFKADRIPETPYTQVLVSDPNGIILETNFEEQIDDALLQSDLVLERLAR